MTAAKSERYVFLDVLRAFAVIWMIQVHITNVVLADELKHGWWYNLLNISNGFVAPAFIFCAGCGLYIALTRKGSAYLQLQPALWDYLRRLSYVLFWAYMFHVPVFAFSKFSLLPTDAVRSWLQFDVLHTIVYASLIVLGLFLVLRSVHWTSVACGILAGLVFTTTVFVQQWVNASDLPYWLAYAFSNKPPSTFPIVPWSGYLFAGMFFSNLFFRVDNKLKLSRWLVGLGVTLPVVIFWIKSLDIPSPWHDVWWYTSPGVHGFRICGLMVGFGGLFLIEDWLKQSRTGTFLQIVGMESLFLYLSHLQVVYGAYTPDILENFGWSQGNYLTVATMWIALTIPLLVAMYGWHWFKRQRPTLARWVLAMQIVVTLLIFLLR